MDNNQGHWTRIFQLSATACRVRVRPAACCSPQEHCVEWNILPEQKNSLGFTRHAALLLARRWFVERLRRVGIIVLAACLPHGLVETLFLAIVPHSFILVDQSASGWTRKE